MTIFFNVNQSSGDWDSDVAGTDKNGATIHMNDNARLLVTGLSARLVVEAETDTLTIEGRWQISDDNVTFEDVVQPNNPADVVLATGTAGADPIITKSLAAPQGVYGARFARIVLQNGVVTGNTVDTFAIGYVYRTPGFETF